MNNIQTNNSVNENQILWKYMTLPKFLHLLEERELHCTNLRDLSDEYEGTLPSRLMFDYMINSGKTSKEIDIINENIRSKYYVSCWNCSAQEQYVLWKVYAGLEGIGIAIKTDLSKLDNCIIPSKTIEITGRKVEYDDTEILGEYSIVSKKGKYYSAEDEFRLIVELQHDNKMKSIDLEIRPEILIEEIYYSPFAPKWFFNTFFRIVFKQYPYLKGKIKRSGIKDKFNV